MVAKNKKEKQAMVPLVHCNLHGKLKRAFRINLPRTRGEAAVKVEVLRVDGEGSQRCSGARVVAT